MKWNFSWIHWSLVALAFLLHVGVFLLLEKGLMQTSHASEQPQIVMMSDFIEIEAPKALPLAEKPAPIKKTIAQAQAPAKEKPAIVQKETQKPTPKPVEAIQKSPEPLPVVAQKPAEVAPLAPQVSAPAAENAEKTANQNHQPAQESAQKVAVASTANPRASDHASGANTLPSSNADYLNNPKPAYPRISKNLGEQGTVLLRVLIDAQGLPEQVEIKESSGFERLDQSALKAVKNWRFVAGKRQGVAQAMWHNVPISFVLD